jgi:hypothetical protein
MFSQVSTPIRIAVILIVANWLFWGFYCIAIGGEALTGEISGGQYLIRRHPNSVPTPVSPAFWLFSLVYTFLTVSGSVLALVLLYVFYRPRWDRGLLDIVAVGLAVVWVLMVSLRAVPRFIEWAAA